MKRVDYEKVVIKELLDDYERKELDINPWYQRRSVWTRPQKAYLINSILEQMPIPSIFIRHYLNIESEKSVKEVVDGQQRIRSIFEYVADDFSARHPNHRNRVKYSQLSRTERADFLMTNLSIGYLIEASDSDVIEVFGRLNSVAKTLNAQEKRNAKYSGEAKQFFLKEAAKRVALWRELRIFTANDIARMAEVEFVSELVLNMLSGLSTHSQAKINYFYRDHDEEFEEQNELGTRLEDMFAKIASVGPRGIRDTIFSRIPLFFTLCIILDSIRADIDTARLEHGLVTIDQIYNRDVRIDEREHSEVEFLIACTSTTQGISQRQIRDRYAREKLGLSSA